jgi:hypothetical protein
MKIKVYSIRELKQMREINYYKLHREELIETMGVAGEDPLNILIMLEKVGAL